MGKNEVASAQRPDAPTPVSAARSLIGWPARAALLLQGHTLTLRVLGADRLQAGTRFEARVHALVPPVDVATALAREEALPAGRRLEARVPLATLSGTWGTWTTAAADVEADEGLRWVSHEDEVWPQFSAADRAARPTRGHGFVRLALDADTGPVAPLLVRPPAAAPGSPRGQYHRVDPRRAFVRLPAFRDRSLVTLTVEVHLLSVGPGKTLTRTLVQRADVAGPAYYAYWHVPGELTLERDLLLLRGVHTGPTLDAKGKGVMGPLEDRFGRTARFALHVALWEEVPPGPGATLAQEETFVLEGAEERVTVRRMLPIVDLKLGKYQVRAAPPLEERVPVGPRPVERRRDGLELLGADGKAFAPRRFLEPAHRARNLSGQRITWEAPATERNLLLDPDAKEERANVEPPFVPEKDPAAASQAAIGYAALLVKAKGEPEWALGRPKGRDALAMGNPERFLFTTLLLQLVPTHTLPLEVRGAPTLESVALGSIGLTVGVDESGQVRGLSTTKGWCPRPRRPDGGDLHIRELMRQGLHMLDGPTRRTMNLATRSMNHWCAAFGPHLYFQLGREPWGTSCQYGPDGTPRSSEVATARNTGRVSEWGTACGRGSSAPPASWGTSGASVRGNVYILDSAHKNHYVTLLGRTRGGAPEDWVFTSVQGNTGDMTIPWAAPAVTTRDADGVPHSYMAASLSTCWDVAIGRNLGAVASWIDLQAIETFAPATLRVRTLRAGQEQVVAATSGDPGVLAWYDLVGLAAGDVVLVSLVGAGPPSRLKAVSAQERVPMGGKLVLVGAGGPPTPKLQGTAWAKATASPPVRQADELFCVRVEPNAEALAKGPPTAALRLEFLGELTYRPSAFLRFGPAS